MRSPLLVSSLLIALVIMSAGCGGKAPVGKYPPRADGCDVRISQDPPGVMSDNIGPVSATCSPDVSDTDCLRTMQDQVCKLGGDLVWGVDPTPETVLQGKKRFSGRAAHSRVAGK